MQAFRRARPLGILFVAMICALPLLVHAQQPDLESSIRAALSQDPRTAAMSQAQVDAMVGALSQKAQQQGVTPQDIAWRASYPATQVPPDICAPFPALFCLVSTSFGFYGPDYTLPLWLGVSSLLLMLLFALHRRTRQAAAPMAPVSVPQQM